MNNVNYRKHEALKHWFQDLTKQAHTQTAPAPAISEASKRNPTKQLAGDLMLIDVPLRQTRRCGVIDFSIVTPAAESYCAQAAKVPLLAAKSEKRQNISNTFKRIRPWTTHTSSHAFVVESGGEPRKIFNSENLQSYHPINGP